MFTKNFKLAKPFDSDLKVNIYAQTKASFVSFEINSLQSTGIFIT